MLSRLEQVKALARQRELMTLLNRFSQDLSGTHNLEKIYEMSYHFTDLGYVLEQLKEAHDFWFGEGEHAETE